ncbi:hypothetical protein pSalSNUABM01_074 [Salmonella phage pSal-SNUABM-01]|nr:hypothetical protein pSalSNUABM01_074 [Salmonella phage pSal-SNUABM-01]
MYRRVTRQSMECDWCFIPMKKVSTDDYSHYYECPRCKEKAPGERFDEFDIDDYWEID